MTYNLNTFGEDKIIRNGVCGKGGRRKNKSHHDLKKEEKEFGNPLIKRNREMLQRPYQKTKLLPEVFGLMENNMIKKVVFLAG